MRALYCLLLICSLLPLSGCADLNISNPFETKSSDGSEVYFDQFPDVPIPRDMSVDAKRSLISVAQDGTKTGLITASDQIANVDYTPFEGFRTQGVIERVYLRGQLAVDHGEVQTGKIGQFIPRGVNSL